METVAGSGITGTAYGLTSSPVCETVRGGPRDDTTEIYRPRSLSWPSGTAGSPPASQGAEARYMQCWVMPLCMEELATPRDETGDEIAAVALCHSLRRSASMLRRRRSTALHRLVGIVCLKRPASGQGPLAAETSRSSCCPRLHAVCPEEIAVSKAFIVAQVPGDRLVGGDQELRTGAARSL